MSSGPNASASSSVFRLSIVSLLEQFCNIMGLATLVIIPKQDTVRTIVRTQDTSTSCAIASTIPRHATMVTMVKPDRKHQYAGVASSDGNGGGGGEGLPVATAVQVAGGGTATSLRRGSSSLSATNNQADAKHDASDKKGDGGSGGGANIHDVAGTDADENGGIQITWEKGEAQRPAFRDVWFAVAFVAHLAAVLGTSWVLGPAAWQSMREDNQINQDGNGDGSDGSDTAPINTNATPGADFWITVVTIATIAAPTLSIVTLGFMSRNAAALIRASLWFSVALCGMAALLFLPLAPPAGILYAVLTGCLACYARSVQHKIPFAACNLTCAIRAIRANLGIALVAMGVLVALVGFACGWSLAFAGVMNLDAVKEPSMDPTYDNSTTDDQELNGLGAGLALLFLLSFYWTHQVLQNTLRASVAGVVGTWWFTPLEASSFCSPAVRDSVLRSSTYSLGSIAFGSLIVAILQLLRSILRSAANDHNSRSNGILQCIAACILLYLERIVEYFNKWSYIYVGLYGYDYITAGKKVIGLFKERGWNTIIADNLVNRLLGIVCLTIGLCTGVITLLAALLVEELESTGGWLGAGFT